MIATREVSYDADGLTMVAHLARPRGEGPWPAVLIGMVPVLLAWVTFSIKNALRIAGIALSRLPPV